MATFEVQPSKDNSVEDVTPDAQKGSAIYLSVQSLSTQNLRSHLEFPVIWGTDIPAGITPDTAVFSLNYYDKGFYNPVGRTYWAYRLTRTDWVELEATWNIYKTGSNWTTAGGDYTVTNGASTTVPASFGWMSWNVLDQVLYAQTNNVNVELLVKDATEGSALVYAAGFHSNNYIADTTLRPKLIIGFTPPAFPTQYSGFRIQKTSAMQELCLVGLGDGKSAMGGVPRMCTATGVIRDIYLVETDDANASPKRIMTTTGIKAYRKKT